MRETRKRRHENRIPESAEQEKFPHKIRRCMSDGVPSTILETTAEHLSQPIEIDDGQHETNYENIDTDRVDVEPSTESQSEKINDVSMKIGHDEAGMI